jgi:phenylalanyl-tRNA synthetase beta chain
LENIFWRWRIEEQISFKPTSLIYLLTSQRAEIFLDRQKIGFIGQVNPLITQNYRISEPVFTAQISLTKIFNYLENSSALTFYQPLSNFPRSEKDLSFIFPTVIDYQQVIQAMKKLGGENLQEVSVFDVYQNAELEQQAKKSVSFHLVFQSFTRTLPTVEVEKIAKLIGEKIEKLFQAKMRDKTTKIGS